MQLRKKAPVILGDWMPINQSDEFVNHNQLVSKHFSFLISEYDFIGPSSSWGDYEFFTKYTNRYVEIGIRFLSGELPWIGIRKLETAKLVNQYHNVAELGKTNIFKEINDLRFSRLKPKVNRYHSRIRHNNIFDRSEIAEDYEKWGKKEQELIINEYSRLIKENPDVLVGDFSCFENNN